MRNWAASVVFQSTDAELSFFKIAENLELDKRYFISMKQIRFVHDGAMFKFNDRMPCLDGEGKIVVRQLEWMRVAEYMKIRGIEGDLTFQVVVLPGEPSEEDLLSKIMESAKALSKTEATPEKKGEARTLREAIKNLEEHYTALCAGYFPEKKIIVEGTASMNCLAHVYNLLAAKHPTLIVIFLNSVASMVRKTSKWEGKGETVLSWEEGSDEMQGTVLCWLFNQDFDTLGGVEMKGALVDLVGSFLNFLDLHVWRAFRYYFWSKLLLACKLRTLGCTTLTGFDLLKSAQKLARADFMGDNADRKYQKNCKHNFMKRMLRDRQQSTLYKENMELACIFLADYGFENRHQIDHRQDEKVHWAAADVEDLLRPHVLQTEHDVKLLQDLMTTNPSDNYRAYMHNSDHCKTLLKYACAECNMKETSGAFDEHNDWYCKSCWLAYCQGCRQV